MLRNLALLTLLLSPALAAAQSDTAVLLDGSKVSQNVKAIGMDGKVAFDGDAAPVDLQGLRRIERPIDAAQHESSAQVFLTGGGAIRASAVTLSETHCELTWPYGQMKLPLSAVRGIRFTTETDPKKMPAGHEKFDAEIAAPPADQDRLFVNVDNKIESLPGVFVALGAEKLKFQYENEDRELDRARVFALALAGGGKRSDVSGMAMLHLSDGSSLWAKVDALANGLASLKMLSGVELKLPWAAVRRLDVRSDRLVFLSDLEPVEVYEKAIAYVGPWQRDRSVRGRALIIKGKTFDKGLGVHATTRLTYRVDPKYNSFAATIGIDDLTKGKGDCEFVVLGDGKELFRKRIKGGEEPVEVRVKLEGARKVTLAVEAGEDLDFADHGNWGDARLIRE